MREAGRLLSDGNVPEGQAKLDEAGEADEKALAELNRMIAEKRKSAAKNARAAAVLVRGTSVLKALGHYHRAASFDPTDAQTWLDYAETAVDAARLDVAKNAYEQAVAKARDANNPRVRYWATIGLGDVAKAHGNGSSARRLYEAAAAIGVAITEAEPNNADWQRDVSVSLDRIADVLKDGGDGKGALENYRRSLVIAEKLAADHPKRPDWQRDLAVSNERLGDMHRGEKNAVEARKSFETALRVYDELVRRNPSDLQSRVNSVLPHFRLSTLDPPKAREHLEAALAVLKPLAAADRLDAMRRGWIGTIEAELGKLAAPSSGTGQPSPKAPKQ